MTQTTYELHHIAYGFVRAYQSLAAAKRAQLEAGRTHYHVDKVVRDENGFEHMERVS